MRMIEKESQIEVPTESLPGHPRFAHYAPLRIAMTGASGLVGQAFTHFLTTGGHTVFPVVRHQTSLDQKEIFWDPAAGEMDADSLEGFDVVIHLAGESIGAGRWTPARKERILQSRIQGTRLLAKSLARLKKLPHLLLSASAIGFYGDRGEEIIDEQSKAGQGFLSEVCQAWEGETKPAEEAGIRVVHMRTGIVLSQKGGALARMLPPFRWGLGGRIGSGRQIMSWISLDDLLGAIEHIIFTGELSGPVNMTAPHPVTNQDFTNIVGRLLKRPTILPLPSFAIKALFGEMGQSLLLEGAHVSPTRLQQSDFPFLYPKLEDALRMELGRF